MVCLNEVTLLAVRGISLHINASLAIFDGEQHLILGIGCECGPLIDVHIIDSNCKIIRVEGIDE
jgi:hypothetical protein